MMQIGLNSIKLLSVSSIKTQNTISKHLQNESFPSMWPPVSEVQQFLMIVI